MTRDHDTAVLPIPMIFPSDEISGKYVYSSHPEPVILVVFCCGFVDGSDIKRCEKKKKHTHTSVDWTSVKI